MIIPIIMNTRPLNVLEWAAEKKHIWKCKWKCTLVVWVQSEPANSANKLLCFGSEALEYRLSLTDLAFQTTITLWFDAGCLALTVGKNHSRISMQSSAWLAGLL